MNNDTASSVREQVMEAISRVLTTPTAELGPDPAMYRTAGWDSLAAVDLLDELEAVFRVKIPDDEIENCTSARQIAGIIDRLSRGATTGSNDTEEA